LAPKALGLASAQELSGARICVQAGTASQDNLADYFNARGLHYRAVVVPSEAEARRLYQQGACDVFTADVSALAGSRSVLDNPNAHEILPDVISKEPLGPVVRQNDPVWADIVRWSVYAIILGEELGLTSKTVEQARETASDPQTRRLLGVEGDYGALLGLRKDWAFQVIRQVGAYHEIFRRDIGADSPLKLDRGLNALWSAPKPGLLYAPPFR
jgi:general L-amino acid transport system substrate-binding protein